jgi:hypothetical protein
MTQEKALDFSTNGFLDEGNFQITASAQPDTSAKGLVAQRESAAIRARAGLQDSAVRALVEYRMIAFTADHKADADLAALSAEARANISVDFRKYLASGAIAEEYYEKDNSASVVYRISKSGLKGEIDRYTVKIKTRKEEAK